MNSKRYMENVQYGRYGNKDLIRKFIDEMHTAKELTEKFEKLIKDNNYSPVVLMLFAYHLNDAVKESLVFKAVEDFHKKLSEESL